MDYELVDALGRVCVCVGIESVARVLAQIIALFEWTIKISLHSL